MTGPAWTLHEGEALAWLATLATGSVDAVVTDAPYSSGGQFRGDRVSGTTIKYATGGYSGAQLLDFAGDNRDQRGFGYWAALWLSEALRVTRPGGVCCLFSDWRTLPAMTDTLQSGGWVWRGVVPWAKPFNRARPQPGRFSAQCEYVVWGSHGPMPVDYAVKPLPGWFEGEAPRGKARVHPAEKPVNVLRELVKITPVEGVVLDPFAGSGTTGLACLAEGRSFAGCESVPRYAELARQRLTLAAGDAPPPGGSQGLLEAEPE